MRTEELQREIKKLLAEMNWTKVKAAKSVYFEVNDFCDEGDELRYVEKFKKWLSRPTTRPECLEEILKILCSQRAARNLKKVKLTYVPGQSLTAELQEEMKKISRSIDRDMKDEPPSSDR